MKLDSAFALLLVLLAACSKNDPVDPGSPAATLRIDAVNPGHGSAGSTVVITGVNFSTTAATNKVRFAGSQSDATVSVASATSLSVVVPADAITGKITLRVQTNTALSPADFVVDAPAAAITDFNPKTGPAGTVVTINGNGFANNSQVILNGVAATISSVTATEIQITVPALQPGGYRIEVISGNVTLQSAADFVVTAPVATAQWISIPVNAAPAAIFSGATSFVYKNKIYWGFTKISSNQAQADYMILDPAAGNRQWVLGNTPPADMVPAQLQHATAVVHNDKVFIGTGLAPAARNSWWEYNPETNTSLRMTDHPVATSGALSFVLNNQVFAGFGGTNKTLYRFDPAGNGSWTEAVQTNIRELTSASAFVIGNEAYIGRALLTAGGQRIHFMKYSGGNTFTPIASLPEEIQSPKTPSFVSGNRGYFVTGNKVWEYNPANDTWTAVAFGAGTPVIRYTATVMIGGNATVLGWTDKGELFEFRKNP